MSTFQIILVCLYTFIGIIFSTANVQASRIKPRPVRFIAWLLTLALWPAVLAIAIGVVLAKKAGYEDPDA